MKLIHDRTGAVVNFVTSRIKYPLSFENVIHEDLAVVDASGQIRAGCIFHLHKPLLGANDIELTAAADPGWFRKSDGADILRRGFMFAFHDLCALRLTATTHKANRKSRKLIEKLGFQMVGPLKWGLGYKKSAILYGMTFEDCRFLTDADKAAIGGRFKEKAIGSPLASEAS